MPEKKVFVIDVDEEERKNPATGEGGKVGSYHVEDFISVMVPPGYTHVATISRWIPQSDESELPEKMVEEGGYWMCLTSAALKRIHDNPDAYTWVEGQPFPCTTKEKS